MRFLKENYDGLQEVDNLPKELKVILLEPDIQKALQKNDFNTIYEKLPSDLINDFTRLLISLNIDPLNYLDHIPDRFLASTSVKHIDIPSNITSIGNRAFYNCDSLTSATISNGVMSIGNRAFKNCIRLTDITIPDSVTSIGSSAFYGCLDLSNVTIGNSVTSIGSDAFSGCGSLTNIIIPNSVMSIGTYAFYRCSGLTSITIPSSMMIIGDWALYFCTSLNYITYGGTKDQWGKIKLGSGWNRKSPIKAIHCADGDIEL